MDPAATAAKTAEEAREHLKPYIRDAYPYLKTNILDDFLNSTAVAMQKMLIEQEPAMTASKNRTSFFSLSAELRNKVYGEVFHLRTDYKPGHQDVWIQYAPFIPMPSNNGRRDTRVCLREGCLNLLQISKRIRDEAKPIFWGTYTFKVKYLGYAHQKKKKESIAGAREWLKMIGKENAALIRTFMLMPVFRCGGDRVKVTNAELLRDLDLHGLGLKHSAVRVSEVYRSAQYF